MKARTIKREDLEYSFEKWLNGYPKPDHDIWAFKDGKINPEYTEIRKAENFVFEKSFEILLSNKRDQLDHFITKLDLSEKIDFVNAELETAKSIYSKYSVQDLLKKSHPDKLKDIDSTKYLQIKNQIEGLNSGKYLAIGGVFVNDFHSAIVNYHYSKYCHQLLSQEFKPEKIEVEAYKNLPHILCILDDLGILELIEEKFSNKYYKGTARHTDHAKLIATILGIEDGEIIRQKLKNKDYLSKKAKQNAVNTLKSLGLEPSKFID